jgi:hypothetical protein
MHRTAPLLPMRAGSPEQRTHDYVRHDPTTLFAALEIATGKVTAIATTAASSPRVPAVPQQVERASYPDDGSGFELHLVMDNYAAHTRVEIRDWLAANPAGVQALHPDLRVLAEHGRDLVRHHRTPSYPPRHLPVGEGTQRQDPRLHRRLERPRPSLHLDQNR